MKKICMIGLAVAALTCWKAPLLRAEEPAAEGGDKVFEADKGPETLDVSAYPKEQQENYKVFSVKCSKCHTLARPINSKYALPAEWTAYVDKMRHKKRSGIDEDSQKTITSFLIYDSSVRKKDLIAEKQKDKKSADTKAPGKTDEKSKDAKDAPAKADATKN